MVCALGNMADVEERDGSSAGERRPRCVLGLIASPGYCERVAHDLEDALRGYLAEEVDEDTDWQVEVVTDPLTGSDVDLGKVLEEVDSWIESRRAWDFAISLTDLPVRVRDRIIVARARPDRHIGVISVPSLGFIRVQDHVRAMILQMMQHFWQGSTDEAGLWRKIGKEAAEQLDAPDVEGDVEYGLPGRAANLKLLGGMVYANRPWTLFPSFKKTISAAFATGGYGLIFTTLWEIGNLYGLTRLVTFMALAMAILTAWIIVAHGLWEPKRMEGSRYLWSVYNTTTVLTIASGVVFSYAIIFVLLFLASFFYIPVGLLEDTIGTEVNIMSYVRIAWVTASVATVVGAIGAGLEDTDAVRNATFGWRQQNRWQQHNEEKEAQENSERD